ncbi:RhoGEF domain-containing protein [Heterostelium album PN500]|uniref:RhoGEF domain-containing protein n=1 Tax=Heterostelium pallidum (strain ATCC 26659 / Pp 5 / PN500) TaxID=670386 RepID=D3BF42_HETP5|nr:RhoGEF domain-containing protein [Heterostelium album PN500]EFA80523.1 RhoGEF domain-containing protein [Heterostelium album PN500]|eukprot:XP_020432643.1 RhoGEF domain-containing protein [Heterostelium album PN500]
MTTLTASTLAAQRITALQVVVVVVSCHLCHNELGDRCWQCNYLGRPNSKFCFRCNAKLHVIDMPTPDSILPIPPYRPNSSQQQQQNNNTNQLYTHNVINGKLPSTLNIDMSSPSSVSSMPASPRGLVDTEPAIHSIRSIIDSINTKSATATTSPPNSTPRSDAKSRFSMVHSKRSITPTSPPSPSSSTPTIPTTGSMSTSNMTNSTSLTSIVKSTSTSFDSFKSLSNNNTTTNNNNSNSSNKHEHHSSSDKPFITITVKHENNGIIDYSKRLSSNSSASGDDNTVSINLLDQLLADTTALASVYNNRNGNDNNQNNIDNEEKDINTNNLYDSNMLHNSNALTSITPLTTLSGSPVSNSTSTSSPCLMLSTPNLIEASASPCEQFQSPRGNTNNADEASTSTTTNNNHQYCNNNSSSNNINNTISSNSSSGSGKRRSFSGSGSLSIFNEIIDAFPTPPETMILSPTNSNSGKNGANSSTILSPKTPLSASPSPKSTATSTSLASDQRTFLIKEIISTELDYINDLETIITVFYRPLRDDLKLISTEECASVFSNIEQIFEVNKELYSKMINSSSTIGEVFCLMSDSLDVYSVYCNYHQKSLESLSNLTKLPQIESFISDIISKPELRGMNLHSFLIKPVQRICKYPLLLRELLKATPNDHLDYGQLISAVAKIEQIVNIINKEKMENETWQRTMQIIQSLKGAENLQLSKRHLLNEGNLQMVEGYNENSEKKSTLKFKKGFFFLFNDIFLFAKQKGSVYRLILSVPLDTVLVHSSISTDKHFFTLVEIGIGGKRWTFFPQSKAQNQVLVISIQKLIEKCWEGRYDPKPTLAANNNGNQGAHSPSMQKKKINRLVKSLKHLE